MVVLRKFPHLVFHTLSNVFRNQGRVQGIEHMKLILDVAQCVRSPFPFEGLLRNCREARTLAMIPFFEKSNRCSIIRDGNALFASDFLEYR